MGYHRPRGGGIRFNDVPLHERRTFEIARLGLGFAPEESGIFPDLTVAENIEISTWTRPGGRPAAERLAAAYEIFPELTVLETLQAAVISRLGRGARLFASLAADSQVQADALEIASLFNLADKAHALARALPQGDKKLLDVASAFALRPEIILLDEPTSGVSTADKHTVMEILVGAAERVGLRAIIQVEHDMDIVFGYSDRIIALHQGKVLADATPAEIQADTRVVDMVVGRRRAPHPGPLPKGERGPGEEPSPPVGERAG